jgi:hypothetical protein
MGFIRSIFGRPAETNENAVQPASAPNEASNEMSDEPEKVAVTMELSPGYKVKVLIPRLEPMPEPTSGKHASIGDHSHREGVAYSQRVSVPADDIARGK